MRWLITLSALGLSALGLSTLCLAACGDAGKTSASTVLSSGDAKTPATAADPASIPPAPVQTKTDADKDDDLNAIQDEPSSRSVPRFGQTASASEQKAIAAVIRRYYVSALAENGVKACTLLYSTITESVPEDYGTSPPGPAYMRGTSCATVLKLLFKHFHPQISLEYPLLEIGQVRVTGHHGVAVLKFGKLPERDIQVEREGHTWKLAALLDSELP